MFPPSTIRDSTSKPSRRWKSDTRRFPGRRVWEPAHSGCFCYCIIHCKTLGEALDRAEEFHQVLYRLTGHRIHLSRDGDTAVFDYRFETDMALSDWAPEGWDRTVHYEAIAQSSGLRTWGSIMGWLIGRTMKLDAVQIAGPFVSDQYQSMLDAHFGCPVKFGADTSVMRFSTDQLEQRVVQTPVSLEHFLGHAVYQYWMEGPKSENTSTAIKSLISGLIDYELPRFEDIADRLHMSASTLRRRLMDENTSYQQLKDECREAAAIEHLHRNELKIHEIGELLGFSETSSFVRSFRNWTGMTPKAYRVKSREIAAG